MLAGLFRELAGGLNTGFFGYFGALLKPKLNVQVPLSQKASQLYIK